ncbi:MAG: LOG family protein [Candidatus Altimarinota bacterium]
MLFFKKIRSKRLNLKKELKRKNRFRVAIFGSARVQKGDKVYHQVYDLAKKIGQQGYDLITGGGPGLMEAANSGHTIGDKKSSVDSIGLVIELPFENEGNKFLDISEKYKRFSTRLDTFLALSNVMVVTKGGIGTLLELSYMWQHLQVHHVKYHPIILIGKMWEELIDWMKKDMLTQGLVSPGDFDFIYIAHDNEEAMAIIQKFHQLHKDEGDMRKIICSGSKCIIPELNLQETVLQLNQKSMKKTVKKVAKKATKKPAKKVAKKATKKPAKKVAKKATKKPVKKTAKKAAKKKSKK